MKKFFLLRITVFILIIILFVSAYLLNDKHMIFIILLPPALFGTNILLNRILRKY